MPPKRKSLLLAAHTISKRSSLETKLKSPTLGLCYWLCPVGEPIWRVASCHLALHKHKNMRFSFFYHSFPSELFIYYQQSKRGKGKALWKSIRAICSRTTFPGYESQTPSTFGFSKEEKVLLNCWPNNA